MSSSSEGPSGDQSSPKHPPDPQVQKPLSITVIYKVRGVAESLEDLLIIIFFFYIFPVVDISEFH